MTFLFVVLSLETFLHCCFNDAVFINCVNGPLRGLTLYWAEEILRFSPAEKVLFMRLLYQ